MRPPSLWRERLLRRKRTASTGEQLLRENIFCESGAAVSKRPPLENTFLNAPSFPARTLSPVKSIPFVEPLLPQNKFCDTFTAVCGNPLFQNSVSVCSSRMRFVSTSFLENNFLPLCRPSVLVSWYPCSVGKVYLTCLLGTRTQFCGTHSTSHALR